MPVQVKTWRRRLVDKATRKLPGVMARFDSSLSGGTNPAAEVECLCTPNRFLLVVYCNQLQIP